MLELVIVLFLILILSALTISGIQHVREGARRVDCSSRLKNAGLSVHGFVVSHGELPSPLFADYPGATGYVWDAGVWVRAFPFFEGSSSFGDEDRTFAVSKANSDRIRTTPSFLLCPSAGSPADLVGLGQGFNVSVVPELSSQPSGIVANFGVYGPDYMNEDREVFVEGPFTVTFSSRMRRSLISDVSDGLSQTFLAWESAADLLWLARVVPPQSFQFDCPDQMWLMSERGSSMVFHAYGQPFVRSYLYSWAGLGIGWLSYDVQKDGDELHSNEPIINFKNKSRQPFSYHPHIANFCRMDGAVNAISDSVDSVVVIALATAGNGD